MIAQYTYIISGTAANDQTWIVRGLVECDFSDAYNTALRETFQKLTQGKARYGYPGIGCHGPYRVIHVSIIRKRNNDKETKMALS